MDIWMDVDAALSEVPVNLMPLIDDTDFKTREEAVTYDQAGLDLVWNFVTTAGAMTQTAVTPTDTGGNYDWVNQGNGMYSIEIPASGGASINNDTEGFGWFTGYATGILPWRGPVIGFRAAGLNNVLVDSAYSATRGLAGTALPDAAAGAAGGLPISNAGALDLDAKLANTNEVTAARMGALTDLIDGGRLDLILDNILTDTGTTLDGKIDTIDGIADDIKTAVVTNAAGADIAADIIALKAVADDILTDTGTTIPGAMALASVCTEARLSELDAATGGKMANQVDIIQTDTTTDIPALIADVPTVAEFEARTKVAADYFDPATDEVDIGKINGVTLTGDGSALDKFNVT